MRSERARGCQAPTCRTSHRSRQMNSAFVFFSAKVDNDLSCQPLRAPPRSPAKGGQISCERSHGPDYCVKWALLDPFSGGGQPRNIRHITGHSVTRMNMRGWAAALTIYHFAQPASRFSYINDHSFPRFQNLWIDLTSLCLRLCIGVKLRAASGP